MSPNRNGKQDATERVPESEAASVDCAAVVVNAQGRSHSAASVRLGDKPVVVGSADDCDLIIDDGTVSRRHLQLSVSNAGVLVRDLDSTNGTFYLGQRIESAQVRIGTMLRLGECELAILPRHAADSATLPALYEYGDLQGVSLSMRRVFGVLQQLEGSEAPVVIDGETGTGKELVARAIHQHSARSKAALQIVDCGSMPAGLIESELFGHTRGAFSGAISDRDGAFVAAHGGTLFLDEIGELPTELQPRLLRVVESGEVKPIGADRFKKVDVRIIAATHRNLEDMVRQGTFREDLFYRLAVLCITLPALRNRREDIPLLVRAFLDQSPETRELPPRAIEYLSQQPWPGNARELRNAVVRLAALGVAPLQAPPKDAAGDESPATFRPARRDAVQSAVDTFERGYLEQLMGEHQGNMSAAARAADIERKYLRELLRKHDLYDWAQGLRGQGDA